MKQLLPVLVVALLIAGCAEKEGEGVYLTLSLENDADIDSYVVFNPSIRTVSECEESVAEALPSIMSDLPPEIPMNSKVTGWECSLTDPTEGKMEESS